MPIKYAQIGAISSGTLRTEDLLQAFASELEYHIKRNKGTRGLDLRAKRKLVHEADTIDSESDDAEYVLDELGIALQDFAPPYATFGTAEGDAACFGFLPVEAADLPKFNNYTPDDFEGDCLLVSDYGSVMCGRKTKKGFVKYWSCV